MHMHQYSLLIVALSQLLFISCSSVEDDGGLVAKTISAGLNYRKHKHRLNPIYPNANKDAWPLKVESYDFIIAGASPSGIALANRLSENRNWRILLLEAGEEPASPTEVPFACVATPFSEYSWTYRTERQEGFCRGCINGNVFWSRGKGLGGSTIFNYMLYVRGNKRDYQRWYEQGNPSWSYEEVLPYFLKSEDANITWKDEGYHGRGGYLKVSDVPYRSKSAHVWVQAAQEAGYPYVDYNGRQQYGVSYTQATIGNGRRSSAESAFLRPIRNRSNLKIRINALVSKVLVDSTNTAYGVEYIKNGITRRVLARKEVILSAGALNSPQILMLSGIGPANHLRELGIPVIKDLPVGEQMYDHITFSGLSFLANESITVNLVKEVFTLQNWIDFYFKGTGPFTETGGVEALTYIKTNVSKKSDLKHPDIELIYVAGSLHSDLGLFYRRIFNVPKATYNRIWRPVEGKSVFAIFPMLLHPESRGFMKLSSRDPRQAPLFYPNYLSDPKNKDVRNFIASVRIVQKIVSMPAFQRYGPKILDTPLPGCEHIRFDTDEYWECAVRSIVGSFWHQVSTCKMGPPDDPEAVVDNELQVYGINGLRVVDTSIIPVTLSAHITAAAYMIGEKAADCIKSFWLSRPQ